MTTEVARHKTALSILRSRVHWRQRLPMSCCRRNTSVFDSVAAGAMTSAS